MSSSTPTNSHQSAPLIDSFQPTVRVMRLYKPGFHLVQSLPHLPQTLSSNAFDTASAGCADFTLSPYLLLPDSFGDIYAGEKFSAYIAVVNGFVQVPFYQVTLAVRLQTSTTVIDLADTRAQVDATGAIIYGSKTLSCNETFDMIVSQTLTELGIHTLRVSVQYLLTPTSEMKTLRKFYRFNVLQPLVIQSSYVELNGKPMVQCEVTNATKSPIYIDELSYIPTSRSSVCVPISATSLSKSTTDNSLVMSDVALCEDLKLLLPGESAAFAFMFTEYSDLSGRPPGFPQVKWCTSMGEFSFYRGEYTYPRTTSSSSTADSSSSSSSAVQASGSAGSEALKSIRYECLSCPGELHVGDQVEIVIRVYNTTSRAMSVHLDCKAAVSTQQQSAGVGAGTSGKTGGSGSNSAMRPRLSTHSNNTTYANVLSSSSSTVAAVGASAASSGSRMMEGSSTAAGVGAQCRGLCFSGLTFTPLGIIESLDFSDLSVHVYATSAGQHVMPTLYLIDSISGDRHPIEAACSVFVHDSDEWIDEEEEKVEERVHEVALSSKGLAETKSEPPNAKVKPAAILAPSGAVRPPIPAPTPAPLPPMPATAPVAVPVPVQTAEEQEEKISVEVKVADQAAAIIDTDLIAESAPAEMTFTSAQQLPLVPSACSMESLDLTSSLAQFLEESAKEIEQEFGTATPSPNGPQMGVCDADGIDIDMV